MKTQNILLLSQTILQLMQQMQAYQAVMIKAQSEDRDVTDEEIATLSAQGRAIRQEGREEAMKQRGEEPTP